jgi:hypothetical protein
MVLLRHVAQVKTRFGPFGDSVNLYANRCMVCVKCTIGSEIALCTLDGTPRWLDRVKDCFNLFGDSVNLDTR